MTACVPRTDTPANPRRGSLAVVVALVIGLGLAAAPVAFQMFTRAPQGGTMIDDFQPYMQTTKIDAFRGYLDLIDKANTESLTLQQSLPDYDTQFVGAAGLNDQWPTIQTDMTDLLDRMDRNMGNYAAVAALPSFDLFPWFFVLPGVIIAGLAAAALVKGRKGTRPRGLLIALAVMGLGVGAAPAIFQMFTRAPKGGEMIDDFRPMMTAQRVRNVQGYFISLGGGEGQLRVGVVPAYEATGASAADHPAITQFSAEWPTIVGEFNPMIATMNDNVDNFQAVDAMPSFPLFPWFFVIPGALVAGAAAAALRRRETPPATSPTPEKESS